MKDWGTTATDLNMACGSVKVLFRKYFEDIKKSFLEVYGFDNKQMQNAPHEVVPAILQILERTHPEIFTTRKYPRGTEFSCSRCKRYFIKEETYEWHNKECDENGKCLFDFLFGDRTNYESDSYPLRLSSSTLDTHKVEAMNVEPVTLVLIDAVSLVPITPLVPSKTSVLITIGSGSMKSPTVEQVMQMSKKHASVRIGPEAHTMTIEDTSLNGTFVNGVRLKKLIPVALKPGDVIRICGNFVYGFEEVYTRFSKHSWKLLVTSNSDIKASACSSVSEQAGFHELKHPTENCDLETSEGLYQSSKKSCIQN